MVIYIHPAVEWNTQRQTYEFGEFDLIRSDTGDGGWSLHDRESGDMITSGPSDYCERCEEWARLNNKDYEIAKNLLK